MENMAEQYRLSQSPLAIPLEDVHALGMDEGFQLLRKCLVNDAIFCAFHASTSDSDTRDTWLLHRDLLHALTMPVLQLFRRAASLAQATLCTNKNADLELAFSGDARSAFVWMQCFVGEEEAWCCTAGCPGCIVTATLSTESHLRLTIAASLLSTASVASPPSSPAASASSSPATSPTTEDPQPQTTSGSPTLPPLPHILPALRAALASDPLWGPDYWPYLLSKASQLSGGIQSLITSCGDLEALVESPDASPLRTRNNNTSMPLTAISIDADTEGKGVKLRKSKMAKRQLRMKDEEAEMLRRCALQCWARAAVPSRVRGEVLGVIKEGRERRLTCP